MPVVTKQERDLGESVKILQKSSNAQNQVVINHTTKIHLLEPTEEQNTTFILKREDSPRREKWLVILVKPKLFNA
jgi:hypothetical protein